MADNKFKFNDLFDSKKGAVSTPPPADPDGDEESLDLGALSAETFPRPANKTLPRIHLMKADGSVVTMMYCELASHAAFKGGEFTLLFAGAKHWAVTVKGSGPKFWAVYDYITLARWPFVVEAARGFGADGDTVFTELKITDVTPRER